MNNKAHLRPQDFDSNGDIIPMACKEEKGDLISREALKEVINYYNHMYVNPKLAVDDVLKLIDTAPTVEAYTEEEVQEIREEVAKEFIANSKRPKGDWNYIGNAVINHSIKICECNQCMKRTYGEPNFCPNCGADMQKGGAE